MRISPVIKLVDDLHNDEDYLRYNEIYSTERVIDKDLLIKLLDKYFDLYYAFLKMNIFLYRFDTKKLNKELQDFLRYKGKHYYIDDLIFVLKFYLKHYPRCQSAMRKIITYKIRPLNERNLLKEILNNPIEEQIRPTFEYEVTDDEQ